jgi:hypothetical protein
MQRMLDAVGARARVLVVHHSLAVLPVAG